MPDKVTAIEGRILRFIQQSLDELGSIRQQEQARLDAVRDRAAKLAQELRGLSGEIDRLSKEAVRLREELVSHSRRGETVLEREAYARAAESMRAHASLEERYRILSARREELAKEERALARVVAKSESMGNRLRMAADLVSLPEEIGPTQAVVANDEALTMALRIAEREARSFAQELHDGPTQSFAALGLTLEMAQELLARGDPEAATKEVAGALEQLRGGLNEVRSLLFGLSPTGIESGLGTPLDRLAAQVSRSWGTELTSKLTGEQEAIPMAQRAHVFKTIHQAVVNAAKAGAAHVHVSVSVARRMLKATIVDDGQGFDVETERQAADERGSYGLRGMEERVRAQGGELSVSSTPGKGTTVSFSVPLRGEDAEGGAR